jgi:hypothetical protein
MAEDALPPTNLARTYLQEAEKGGGEGAADWGGTGHNF